MLLGLFEKLSASRPAVHTGKRSDQYTGAQVGKDLTAYLFLNQKGVPLIRGAQHIEGLRR